MFPERVDLLPTFRCNLRCRMCLSDSPYLDVAELDTDKWFKIIDFFADRRTRRAVESGGEFLLRDDAGDLLRYACSKGMCNTLSTNCLLTKRVFEVAPWIDKIGIPLDGATREQNSIMRKGNPRQFDAAITVLKEVRSVNPSLEITIRTVVTTFNVRDLEKIGEKFAAMPGVRWKLYELLPSRGMLRPVKAPIGDIWRVKAPELEKRAEDLRRNLPGVRIDVQDWSKFIFKGYLLVNPQGDIQHWPTGFVGNVLTTPHDQLEKTLATTWTH